MFFVTHLHDSISLPLLSYLQLLYRLSHVYSVSLTTSTLVFAYYSFTDEEIEGEVGVAFIVSNIFRVEIVISKK